MLHVLNDVIIDTVIIDVIIDSFYQIKENEEVKYNR